MTSDPIPLRLVTVLAGDSTAIHLAADDEVVAWRSGQVLTLCHQPVDCRISTQNFHRLGCAACAVEAVRGGITSIVDRRQTAVNLPRFVAALRLTEPRVAPGVPGQRAHLDTT